jgi:hypothetical protein
MAYEQQDHVPESEAVKSDGNPNGRIDRQCIAQRLTHHQTRTTIKRIADSNTMNPPTTDKIARGAIGASRGSLKSKIATRRGCPIRRVMCQGIDMIIMPKNHSHNCAALLRHSMCAAAAVAAAPARAPPMPEPLQPVAHIDLESHDGEPELPMAQHVTAPVSHMATTPWTMSQAKAACI